MANKSKNFSAKETKQRFEAALRGSRNVGPQPMKGMAPKRGNAQRHPVPRSKR
jgi:hypothetical protein